MFSKLIARMSPHSIVYKYPLLECGKGQQRTYLAIVRKQSENDTWHMFTCVNMFCEKKITERVQLPQDYLGQEQYGKSRILCVCS